MFFGDNRTLITFFIHMEHCQRAGVPIFDALQAAYDNKPPRALRHALMIIIDHMKGGATLSESMALFPRLFNETVITLVRVGEHSGKMPLMFKYCADILTRHDDMIREIKRVTRRSVISMAVILLLSFVAFGRGDLVASTAWTVATIAFLILGRKYLRFFRYATDEIFICIPRLRQIIIRHSIARFAETLALLFNAGVNLREALDVSVHAIPCLPMRASFAKAAPRLLSGASLSNALKDVRGMSWTTLTTLHLGETSGNLGTAMQELAEYYNKLTQDAITAFIQMLGPVSTIIAGVLLYKGIGQDVMSTYSSVLDTAIKETSQ